MPRKRFSKKRSSYRGKKKRSKKVYVTVSRGGIRL